MRIGRLKHVTLMPVPGSLDAEWHEVIRDQMNHTNTGLNEFDACSLNTTLVLEFYD